MHHRYPLNKSCLKLIFSYLLVLIPACDIGNKENDNNGYTNFSLEDINPNSPTYGDLIGPSFYKGNASGYYFGDQGWGLCRTRFGVLNSLYEDLVREGYNNVKIAGINGIDFIDSDLSGMIEDRVLPWVQDKIESDVWNYWDISLRDFVILDANGDFFYIVNLTDFDPSIESNYNNLKQLLIDARNN